MKRVTWTKINIVTVLLAMAPLCAQGHTSHGDGTLHLYNDTRKESLDITFRDTQGHTSAAALKKIETFLRSPDDQTHAIDTQLIDLIDAIQDHFHESVIEIISGYRSPDYNHALKLEGHAVANESLHMQGLAMDIHLDTVTEEAVRDYAQTLARGGVGWYPQNDFVHVDVGPVRSWGHAEGARKLVGLNNNPGTLTIRSDANRYFHDNEIIISVTPPPENFSWTLEKFERGTWKTEHSNSRTSLFHAAFRVPTTVTQNLPRGRYRIRIQDSLSNEFYLKN